MWFAIITVIYTGFDPNVNLRPASIVQAYIANGYESRTDCEDQKLVKQDAAMWYGPNYTTAVTCFEGDPRLQKYLTMPK